MESKRRRYAVIATAAALFAALGILAALQYRWIGEAQRAEVERTKAALRRSAEQMSAEFNADVARLYVLVLSGGETEDSNPRAYGDRLLEWMATTEHAALVRALYVTQGGSDGLDSVLRFDTEMNRMEPVQWPSDLEPLRAGLAARMRSGRMGLRPGPPGVQEDLPVAVAPRNPPPPPGEDRGRREGPPPREGQEEGPPPPGEGPGGPPEYGGRPFPRPNEPARRGPFGWVVIQLNTDYLRNEWGPQMYRRFFATSEADSFRVQVVSRVSGRVLFDSEPNAGSGAMDQPDAEAPMFEVRPGALLGARRPGVPPRGGPAGRGSPVRWSILARHRSGSVESIVAKTRWRNLAVSGAAFAIMGIAAGALLLAMRRSEQLSRQQMQFVAAVSHELRTPLAVIRSAAENLADGVVQGEQSMKEYGVVIRDEGRRLSYMVEQTLRFAGIQTGRGRYNLVPVSVATVVDEALSSCDAALKASGCVVERSIPDGLPEVMGDARSLSVCVGNLLVNAAKHANAGGWIGIGASAKGEFVEIEVSDRGPGIHARDLAHIFEPFYRGRRSESDQVPGTGLGLALVRQIITAHHGEVNVESSEAGSRFTLRLPAAAADGAGQA